MTERLLVILAILTLPRLALAQTEDVRYFHSDAIGSVRLVTDANGQVVERYDYLPFGEPWTASPTGTETRRFGGKERDTETGLVTSAPDTTRARTGGLLPSILGTSAATSSILRAGMDMRIR
jgi:hypothetical protein